MLSSESIQELNKALDMKPFQHYTWLVKEATLTTDFLSKKLQVEKKPDPAR